MRAKIKNIATGKVVEVHSTTEHPDSSYGRPVWVDDNGTAYCQVDTPNPFYSVSDVEVSDREEIGMYLRYLRVSRWLTVHSLAEMCGYAPATIVNIEKGKFSPRTDIVFNILSHLGAKIVIRAAEPRMGLDDPDAMG